MPQELTSHVLVNVATIFPFSSVHVCQKCLYLFMHLFFLCQNRTLATEFRVFFFSEDMLGFELCCIANYRYCGGTGSVIFASHCNCNLIFYIFYIEFVN